MNMNMNMTCTCQARSRERRDGEGGGSIRGIGGEARDARRPTGIGACSSQPREEIRKCQCVCARALVQWRISLKKGSNAKPKGGRGENCISFFFSFAQHWRDWATRSAQSSRASAPIVGCRARRQDDFRSRETECGASRLPCYCPRASDSPLLSRSCRVSRPRPCTLIALSALANSRELHATSRSSPARRS